MHLLCHTQVDVIGVHVQDIIHPQDCSEIATIFQTQGNDVDQGTCNDILWRIRATGVIRSIVTAHDIKQFIRISACNGY